MDLVGELFGYLLERKAFSAAIALALVALVVYVVRTRRTSTEPGDQVSVGARGQSTVLRDVRADRDVNVTSEQRNG